MYDMTIQLAVDNGKCLYEQIYEHIKQEIKAGKLLTDERLPSTRSLAEYLQVARSTVEYAYDQLQSEGYIESRPYKGYFVCPLENIFRISEEGNAETNQAVEGLSKSVIVNDSAGKKKGVQYKCDFSPNKIDMSEFPFGIWKRISRNILSDGNSDLFAQGDPSGDYNLRVTISRYLHASRGVECTPEQIVIGAGNDYLLLLLEKILGPDRKVAMEGVTYKRAYHILKSASYPIVTVGMDRSGLKVSELTDTDVNVVYAMPTHQFPTGTIMSIGRRTELLRWAEGRTDRYIIEDDYDSEFRYKGKPIPALQSLDKRGKVIFMGTFSKAIAPAIRVGYMVLPGELLARYQKECSFYSCTVSRIDQGILNEFISAGYFERHLNKMRKRYRTKHDLMLECMESFRDRFHIAGEDAGLHFVLTAKYKTTEEELVRKAEKAGVKVYGLSENQIAIGDEKAEMGKAAAVLVGFGGLREEEILEGIELLKRAWL